MLTILSDDFSPFPFGDRLRERVEAKRPTILLVPEQMALSVEKEVALRFPAYAPLCLEVSNFSRLCDRVFRTEGGLSAKYADKASESVLMWKALTAASPFLRVKRSITADLVKEQLAALAELSASGVKEQDLKRVAFLLPESAPLKNKLLDLALIYDLYEGERKEIYGSLSADLEKLLAILREKPLFEDTEIYVFGFTSFTADEIAVLGEIMRKGHLFVALPLPEDKGFSLSYEEVTATKKALLSLCDRVGSRANELPPVKILRPSMLAYAKEHLFRAGKESPAFEGNDASLSFIEAKDPYQGCAHIASLIAKAVRAGARYRDFTVVTRSPDRYSGILDEALSKEGIPFFFSENTDITELSLSKMILSAYAILTRGFMRTDLIAYLKCGFSGIARDECDLFELYVKTWKIRGAVLRENRPFDMHPRGYTREFTQEDTQLLDRVNSVRERALMPLLALKEATEGEITAKEHSLALYRFLTDLETEKRLFVRAKEERAEGRVAEADRLLRLSSVIYGLLDRICEIMGEIPLARSEFFDLLSLLFSTVSLGTLPTVQDAVTVSDADTFRPSGCATVFLLGTNEGEFPAATSLGGAFPESERTALLALGLTVGQPPEVRASREQFSFLRAIAAPSQAALCVTFEAGALGDSVRPSTPYRRLRTLFPGATVFSGTPESYAAPAALSEYFELRGTEKGEALSEILADDPTFLRLSEVTKTPVFDPDCFVSVETAKRLFPDRMRASQSKLEDFLNCPFAYYCRRALSLQENETAAVRPVDVGNIIHAILERFFDILTKEGVDIHTVDAQKIPAYVEEACGAYLYHICPPSMHASPRLSHLFARVRRAAVLVVEDIYDEFCHSDFSPAFCELTLEAPDGPGALVFRDKDGKSVILGGKIDRVDTYKDENGDLFVRVVDYKTGSRKFSREDLKNGRNLQMFIYLCAIWKSERRDFLTSLGVKEGAHPFPAGIVYNMVDPKSLPITKPLSEDEVKKALRKTNFARDGFFIDREDILYAMDNDLSHLDLPRKKGKLDTDKKDVFASNVEFGSMLDVAENAVLTTAERMRAGDARICPSKETDPCAFCAYRTVCRKENAGEKKF